MKNFTVKAAAAVPAMKSSTNNKHAGVQHRERRKSCCLPHNNIYNVVTIKEY